MNNHFAKVTALAFGAFLLIALARPAASAQPSAGPQLPPVKQAYLDRQAQAAAAAQAAVGPNAKALDPGKAGPIPQDPDRYVDDNFSAGLGTVIEVQDPPPGDTSVIVHNM